jgi:hypothetical protein
MTAVSNSLCVRRSYPWGQSGQQGSNGTFSSVPMGVLLGLRCSRLTPGDGPRVLRPDGPLWTTASGA